MGEKSEVYHKLRSGKVLLYELPSVAHEHPLWYIGSLLARYNIQEGDVFRLTGRSAMTIAAGIKKEPDTGIISSQRISTTHGPGVVAEFPSLQCEVGWSESLLDLDQDAQEWLHPNTDVQAVLIWKNFKRRKDGSVAMAVALYERGNGPGTRVQGGIAPSWCVSYGTAPLHHCSRADLLGCPIQGVVTTGGTPCNMAGIPLYTRRVPAALIYHGHPGGVPSTNEADSTASHDWVFDLYTVQQEFLLMLP
jgi:hypothetical protein